MKHRPTTVFVLLACVVLDRVIALLAEPDLFGAVFAVFLVAAVVAIMALRSRIAWAVFLFIALSALLPVYSQLASGALPAGDLSITTWAHLVLQSLATILLLTPQLFRWVWKRERLPQPIE